MIKETPLAPAQSNEFQLNHLGYYCKVNEEWQWNNLLKRKVRKGFKFDIIQYENCKEVMVQRGTRLFECGELEAIKRRNEVIEYYLNKLKNN